MTFLDVRETEECRRSGMIPGALRVSRGMLEFCADTKSPLHKAELDPSRTIVTLCATGQRSLLAAQTLTEMGYENVWNLTGGIKAWKAAGGATQRHGLISLPRLKRRTAPLSTHARYERIARFYDLLDLYFEQFRYRSIRAALFAPLSGRILDAGVGTGRNMPFYPADAEVDGIDFSAKMLQHAQQRSARLGTRVTLSRQSVFDTNFSYGHFDHIVATFLFCVLDDDSQLPALRELRRICKPGGSIHIVEYRPPEAPLRRAIMGLWAPWVHWAYGAAFDRRTEQYAGAAGLEIISCRYVYRDIICHITARPKQSIPDAERSVVWA